MTVETVIGTYTRIEDTGRAADGTFTRTHHTCTVEGCMYPHKAKGYCVLHYTRVKKYGNPEGRKIREVPAHCTAEDCTEPDIHAKGYCYKHYIRWYRTGDPNRTRAAGRPKGARNRRGPEARPHLSEILPKVGPAEPRIVGNEKLCGVDNCDKPHDSKGYCKLHYARWQRHGNPHAAGKAPAGTTTPAIAPAPEFVPIEEQCSIGGCRRRQTARTYCKNHYRRWLDYGDPEGTPDTRENPGELPDHLKHYLERRRTRIARQEQHRPSRN